MTFFTSYAQNFEDVILWRALKHVKNGFYIDVGANDPEVHSVTKAFYERGWYGINIEPMPEFAPRFAQLRPRDINLGIAAGSSEGELTLYDVPDVRGWASPDSAVAEAHRKEGYTIAELRVPVRKLIDICLEHVDRPIHFLKVDVEGFEREVLLGMDFAQFRPWIVVVEATLPNSTVCNHQEWEGLLLAHGYEFGYFDGLNRFYVAPEQRQLLPVIQVPVNVFDEFVTVHLVDAWQQAEQARQKQAQAEYDSGQRLQATIEAHQQAEAFQSGMLEAQHLQQQAEAQCLQAQQQARQAQELAQHLHTEAGHAQQQAQASQQALQQAQHLMHELQTSLSWRITTPLREGKHFLRRHLVLYPFPLRAMHALQAFAKRSLLWLARQRALRLVVEPLLARVPGLRARLQRTVAQVRQDPAPPPFSAAELALPPTVRELPASARRILLDLTRHSS